MTASDSSLAAAACHTGFVEVAAELEQFAGAALEYSGEDWPMKALKIDWAGVLKLAV